MNEYLIIYIDYNNDSSCEYNIFAESSDDAIEQFKKLKIKYWRIVDVILLGGENYDRFNY